MIETSPLEKLDSAEGLREVEERLLAERPEQKTLISGLLSVLKAFNRPDGEDLPELEVAE